MSECFRELFIEDGVIKSCGEFNGNLFNEGKSIYEVLRIMEGVPLFLERHLERFKNSAALIGKSMPMNDNEIREHIAELVESNSIFEGNVKIVFNYGNNVKSFFYFVKHSYPSSEQYENGVDTILFHGERTNPNAKVINKDFREKVECKIKESNVYEAILVDNSGYITEGSKSNIFMIKGDRVLTSPLEAVLPGVTRGLLIKLLKELNIPVSEEKVRFDEIALLDALIISGTSPKVLPVRRVDNYHYNSSMNDIVVRLMEAYDKKSKDYINTFLKK